MEEAPLLDQFYRFSYGSLFAAVLLLPPLLQARLHPAIRLSILRLLLPPLESYHDYLRFQVISRDSARQFSSNFGQGHEGVGIRVVDGNLMVLEGAKLREKGGEVDCLLGRGDLHIQQQRLLRLFFLENKSARPVLRPTLHAIRNGLNFRQLNLHSKNIYLLKVLILIDFPPTPHVHNPPGPLSCPSGLPLQSVSLFLSLQSALGHHMLTKFLGNRLFFGYGYEQSIPYRQALLNLVPLQFENYIFCDEISPFRKGFTSLRPEVQAMSLAQLSPNLQQKMYNQSDIFLSGPSKKYHKLIIKNDS